MGDSDFWDTMKILVGKEYHRNVLEDIQDWVEKVVPRRKASVHEVDEDKKRAWTRMVSDVDTEKSLITDDEILRFKKKLNLPKIDCKFCHPKVRLRLEKLMGTQICNLTDREFMLRFQERIMEDYSNRLDKRMKGREEEELERIKRLVLTGTIPFTDSPKELADHPIMLIDEYCNKLIAERRAKIKIPKVKIPTFLYWDDTPDAESGLNIGLGHVFRTAGVKLCLGVNTFLEYSEEQQATYKMPDDKYEKLIYQSPQVKALVDSKNVIDMYKLADKIIGALKLVDENTAKMWEDVGSNHELAPSTT